MAPAWYMIGATTVAQVALMLMRESAPRKTVDFYGGATAAALV